MSSAAPGMPWSDIAASAYRAYAASTGNKNFRGDPMPAFADLPRHIQVAWEASVRQVGLCLDDGHRWLGAGPPGGEESWAGWTPPVDAHPIRPEIDPRRTVAATPHDWDAWDADDCPQYGEPGRCAMMRAEHDTTGDHLMLACPGCGQFAPIRVSSPKRAESPSWAIIAGSAADVATLSLTPSVHCVGCCGWHGYLTAGVFRPC